jgi:hypothetical protein
MLHWRAKEEVLGGGNVRNPLWSGPGVASIGIVIVLWTILLVAIISAGQFTSL